MSHHQNAEQNHDINIDNKFFKNVGNLKYLRTKLTNENCKLNSWNACYHSAENLLCSHLLSKNVKIKMRKTIILPSIL
jgi:hypothetical protein